MLGGVSIMRKDTNLLDYFQKKEDSPLNFARLYFVRFLFNQYPQPISFFFEFCIVLSNIGVCKASFSRKLMFLQI